ncbi:MAG TPA: hypothetical protein PLE99_04195 [Candidatus Thiothrix moscowensis]|uniref:hypothetical protein n=1 Tax=unclassified Thiothrix TaxID=2636184 RepID=UPI0025E55F26|nr:MULTISPECIES: hypothetical protein [unclassified Thiothrix]HRJ51947.1 hypothetical protein [Candidatus Thiothrix moscowensis]HRJ92262.1 hypothetical protein [Candidatus Thiothrix moscowensis]
MTEHSTPTEIPALTAETRWGKWRERLHNWGIHSLDVMRLLTERLMGFLRLFATLGLFLIVAFVVWKAYQSSQLVLVKPFSVPKSLADSHADSGRIIANLLKRELLDAENSIYTTVKRTSNDENINIGAVTGNSEDYLLGSSIKLPETGISITDVVEFISSIFGRHNIVGSVYQDQGKLFLQVELEGRMFIFQRELGSRSDKALNMDLIIEMLRESRIRLLNVASASHNLYYYCSGETDVIEHPDSALQSWFDHCSQLKSSDITPASLDTLLKRLKSAEWKGLTSDNDTLRHILNQTLSTARDKTRLLCPDYPQTQVCKEMAVTEIPQVAIRIPNFIPPVIAPAPAPKMMLPDLLDASAFEPQEMPTSVITLAPQAESGTATAAGTAPLIELPSVRELLEKCDDPQRPLPSGQAKLASNQLDGDGKILFNNHQPIPAMEKYVQALDLNCNNAFAWANMGVLLLAPGTLQSATEAELALVRATKINTKADWMPNSLCIARAYAAPLDGMETLINDESCLAARSINPANKVGLDKQFYIAVADRYFAAGQYEQAFRVYQSALAVDRKRDCATSDVIGQLYRMETEHQFKGAWQVACDILADAVPLPDNKPSRCEEQLTAFKCP